MALSPSRYSAQSHSIDSASSESSMSLAVQNPQPALPDMAWANRRPMELPSRTRSPPEKVELPSIRAMLPDIRLGPSRTEADDRSDSGLSPTSAPTQPTRQAEFSRSPASHKRRRLSSEEENGSEQREAAIPRLERWSPPHPSQRSESAAISPRPSELSRRTSTFSDSWTTQSQPTRTSPYLSAGQISGVQTPPYEIQRSEWHSGRPTLPSLQTLTHGATMPKPRTSFGEYALDSSRATAQPFHPHSAFDPPMSYHPQVTFTYGYQQPRGQSYSGPSYSSSHDRTPFSASAHQGYAPAGYGYAEGEGDNKQRKRRGNLPKETTDKLRSWFVAHLQHPYPTEDEKQELMRQTGLQMNQISNWFINARRRQLPAMINNARAESDARSARPGPGEAGEYRDDEQRGRGGSRESDGVDSPYDQDLEEDFEMRKRALALGISAGTTQRESV